MANIRRNKALGSSYEVDVRDYLAETSPNAKRNGNIYGPKDRGDIGGVPGWTIQCKNTKSVKWYEWFGKVVDQAINNSTRWWVVVWKSRGKNVKESLFVMPLWLGRDLIAHLDELESENTALKARIKELENVV